MKRPFLWFSVFVLLSAIGFFIFSLKVAFGYEPPALQACRFGSTAERVIYTPPSSSSVWTVVDINTRAVITSVSCGPTSTLAIGFNSFPGVNRPPVSCTGYSLKVRSDSTNGGCISYFLGTPPPNSSASISADVSVSTDFSGLYLMGGFFLFWLVFFCVVFYFRRWTPRL